MYVALLRPHPMGSWHKAQLIAQMAQKGIFDSQQSLGLSSTAYMT